MGKIISFKLSKYVFVSMICIAVLFLLLFTYNNGIFCDNIHDKDIDSISPEQLNLMKQKWLAEQQLLQSQSKIMNIDESLSDDKSSAPSMKCLINEDYEISCLKHNEDVFLPFTFIGKYFDVTGNMKHYDGYDRFEFLQSYAQRFYEPTVPYNYHGVFLAFQNNFVENRDSVKCVSGIEGVPVSTQWRQVHFYPIQIAQFGLSHYSKYLIEKLTSPIVYEDGKGNINLRWKATTNHCAIKSVKDLERKNSVIRFITPEYIALGEGLTLMLENTMDYELSFDLKFTENGSISVLLHTTDKKNRQYIIHYVTDSTMIGFEQPSTIYYGIGPSRSWRHISRNLLLDLRKGVVNSKSKDDQKKQKSRISIKKISHITIRGKGSIDNITISKTAHMTYFRDACDWLMKHQDLVSGGWRHSVERTYRSGFSSLPPGWISAMGQGQAMSLLSRAYYVYGDKLYIKALSRALLPFTVPSQKGGVRAVFMDKYAWYEEYPTTPSSFVLNGFIYSLIGLYDFKSLLEDKLDLKGTLETEVVEYFRKIDVDLIETYKLVTTLYDEGMASLKAMLPLYDGGSRTFYDLRHFILKVQPNVARWDYHTTHLSQLALLSTISDDTIFKRYFEYWHGYMKGKVAKHN